MRRKEKEGFKPQRGHGNEGRPCPYAASGTQPGTYPGVRCPHQVVQESAGASPYRFWNEDALSRWLSTENLGWAILDSILTRVLVDNGARVNSVMPAYVRQHNQPGHVSDFRVGSLPEPLWRPHTISRTGRRVH